MEKKSFQPREFQRCTIDWVLHQLFEKKGRGVKRFLVADEVGMGKTIIAKHVVDGLCQRIGVTKKVAVVYVSSSLDIARQNRDKLVSDPETQIVPVDRITLLYRGSVPRSGLCLFAMTPGTSLTISNTLGSVEERAYLAFLMKKTFRISWKRLTRIFSWPASEATFRWHVDNLKRTSAGTPPASVMAALASKWEREEYEGSTFGKMFWTKTRDRRHFSSSVKKIRRIAAEVFLERLKPDLVIFDEFQKFREVLFETESAGKKSLGSYLLKPDQPTLLLSATPYRLFDAWDQLAENSENAHYEDLGELFGFLLGDVEIGRKLVEDLASYGTKVLSAGPTNVAALVEKKTPLEKRVMEVMTRTERSTFEHHFSESVETRFLSSSTFANSVSKEHMYQFLALARHASSPRTYLNYWQSGNHPLSYMRDYEAVRTAKERSVSNGKSLETDKALFTKFRKAEGYHPKVQYINHELLNDGGIFDYLWVPPNRPYYSGEGPYSNERLRERPIRKGLIFSAWRFVPRMIAAELSEGHRANRSQKKTSSNPIKATPSTWLRMFFPSRILSDSLSHKDFVECKSYGELVAVAEDRIRSALIAKGVKVVRKSTNSAWQVIRSIEVSEETRTELLAIYEGRRRRIRSVRSIEEEGAPFAAREYAQFINGDVASLQIDRKELRHLAEVAVSSPSVCIYRALRLVYGDAVVQPLWLDIADLSIRHIRNYINQSTNLQAILGAYPREKTYVNAVARYFKDGNFQAVMDEYISLVKGEATGAGVTGTLRSLAILFSPRRGRVEIPTLRSKRRVHSDIIAVFGEGVEQSVSKDIARIGFNSPFWPFILATTSVGQEGLDFHLYCNEIVHWNLPSNPVDFEQREGRINRYSSQAIRRSIVESAGELKVLEGEETYWQCVFEQAYAKGHRHDRYNLGLSPHWIFTPTGISKAQIVRHILDMPSSNDRTRYENLMRDVSLYRLALGQPKQMDYLARIRENPFLSESDPRGFILCFFPFQYRDTRQVVTEISNDRQKLELLLKDVQAYLFELKRHPLYTKLKREIDKHVVSISAALNAGKSIQSQRRTVESLFYFIDIFDRMNDRVPDIGLQDDLMILKVA